MFTSACVVGPGRVGEAVAARLAARLPVRIAGRGLDCGDAGLVLLCVPDRAVAQVARRLPTGPWVAHTSGALTLAALEPHSRRFSLHPLQTFQRGLGPGQLDGAFAAVSAEGEQALAAALALAGLLGVEPFVVEDAERPLYHAAATMAASFLVTLHDAAAELARAAGVPPEALEPLMRRTIENGFAPTGPLARGDDDTVHAHLRAIRARRPQLEPLYRALADGTRVLPAPALAGDAPPTPERAAP